MKFLFLVIAFFLAFTNTLIFSQKKDSTEITRPYFFLSANFEGNITGKVMPSSGLQVGFGINLARFFTKKFVLGLYYESSLGQNLSTNNRFSYLSPDIVSNIKLDHVENHDSLYSEFLLNAYTKNQFKGCYKQTYGLAFSPFPDKYGEIILFITKGISQYFFDGKNENLNYNVSNYSGFMNIPTDFKATLMFKPLTLTKMKNKNYLKDHLHFGFYIQKTSFKNATIFEQSIRQYLKPTFFTGNKKSEIQFGMRLGIGIGFLKRIRI